MDNPVDFLLDSNWLVTLSSILITVYVFVLGVPILLQQTFLPEKLRETANRHLFFKKQIAGLKWIGIRIIFFVCFLGNPAWKFVYYSLIPEPYLTPILILIHLAGIASFVYITLKIYFFLSEHILRTSFPKFIFGLTRKKWFLFRIEMSQVEFKQTIYLEILESIKADIISECNTSWNDVSNQISYTEELIKLSHTCDNSINRDRYLTAIHEISDKLLSSDNYKGDWIQPLIKDILISEINRNFEEYSINNIKQLIAIPRIVIEKNNEYIDDERDLNSFDTNETVKLLILLSRHLLSNIDNTGFKQLFLDTYEILRKMPNSYFHCFELQKILYSYKEYTYLRNEFIYLKKDLEKKDDYYFFYVLAYIAWLLKADNEYIKEYAATELNNLMIKGKITKPILLSARKFFIKREDFETTDSIMFLNKKIRV